jgi:hypothetical protein
MKSWRVVEIVGWTAQIVCIGLVIRAAPRARPILLRTRTSYLACSLALSLAWAWRLAYSFVLASSGFWYFVADDPCRWLLSWSWAKKPFLITWDGIWQGGTFYLHGLAMRLGSDPLVASKFVSTLYPLIALSGAFLFACGIYRDSVVAVLTVVFLAPWWLHILLGTGAMAEMPVSGLLLAGAGLLSIGLRSRGRRRWRLLMLAAISFAAATSFHMVAWIILAGILGSLLIYAMARGRREGFGVRTWLGFSILSTSYCWIWTVGCWVKFGDPLHFLRHYADLNRAYWGAVPLGARVLLHPLALLETIAGFLPLAVFGVITGALQTTEERGRIRFVLAATAAALLVLVLSCVIGSTGGYPLRATMTLAAALVPISVAPLRSLLGREARSEARSTAGGRRVSATGVVLATIALSWFLANHLKTFDLLRSGNDLDADAIAVGAWLRQEIIRPQALQAGPAGVPIRLWLAEPTLYPMLAILYTSGFPGRIEEWKNEYEPGLSSMRAGQYLISDRELREPALIPRERHGRFTVYRFQGVAATSGREPARP